MRFAKLELADIRGGRARLVSLYGSETNLGTPIGDW